MSRSVLTISKARIPQCSVIAGPSRLPFVAQAACTRRLQATTPISLSRRHHGSFAGAAWAGGWHADPWHSYDHHVPVTDEHGEVKIHPAGLRGLMSRWHEHWRHAQLHETVGNRRNDHHIKLPAGDWSSDWAAKAANEWLTAWAESRAKSEGFNDAVHHAHSKIRVGWRDMFDMFLAVHRMRRQFQQAMKVHLLRRHYHPFQAPRPSQPWYHNPKGCIERQTQCPSHRFGRTRGFTTIPPDPTKGGQTPSAYERKHESGRPPCGGGKHGPKRGFSSGAVPVAATTLIVTFTGRVCHEFLAACDRDEEEAASRHKLKYLSFQRPQPATPAPVKMAQPFITMTLQCRLQAIRRPSEVELELVPEQRKWIVGPCRIFCPILPWRLARLVIWLTSFFKASSSLSVVHTLTRIAMTLVPFMLIKIRIISVILRRLPNEPLIVARRDQLFHNLHMSKKGLIILLLAPLALFMTTMVSSLERTPLTGRPRVILLSPKEEDDVSEQLQGPGWYTAVADILLSNAAEGEVPKVIPTGDWRYQWVLSTLRHLESQMHVLGDEKSHQARLLDESPPGFPIPPPSCYPLVPRPRVSQMVHCFFSEALTRRVSKEQNPAGEGPIVSAPYNLLLVEKPDTSNGFSYGFGSGSAGIVVFSGFLDEILKTDSTAPRTPTDAQTAKLAVLLAHEISHLMLSHHLETLSSSTVLAPNVYNIFSDIARTLLFPATMMLGPFFNDAVANMTRVTKTSLQKEHESCFNRRLEIEADLVSVRILAYAGYDPRLAVEFWEARLGAADKDGHAHATGDASGPEHGNFMQGDTHPVHEERILRLKQELSTWRRRARAARKRLSSHSIPV